MQRRGKPRLLTLLTGTGRLVIVDAESRDFVEGAASMLEPVVRCGALELTFQRDRLAVDAGSTAWRMVSSCTFRAYRSRVYD